MAVELELELELELPEDAVDVSVVASCAPAAALLEVRRCDSRGKN